MDIYGDLLSCGIGMNDIDSMDILVYLDVLIRRGNKTEPKAGYWDELI